MYQFYYADQRQTWERGLCKENIRERFHITAIRPAMWEEHCLECSAPACFESCAHYQSRSDGRCKRFENGLHTFADERACCGQGAHVKFRKWGNMMTVLFPAMLDEAQYAALWKKMSRWVNFSEVSSTAIFRRHCAGKASACRSISVAAICVSCMEWTTRRMPFCSTATAI